MVVIIQHHDTRKKQEKIDYSFSKHAATILGFYGLGVGGGYVGRQAFWIAKNATCSSINFAKKTTCCAFKKSKMVAGWGAHNLGKAFLTIGKALKETPKVPVIVAQ